MKRKRISIFLVLCILVGGCNVKDGEKMDKEKYGIPVQEYTGEEYPAKEKEERWKYIEEHRTDIEESAMQWIKDTFGLETKINHIYPENGAAIATAEWLHDSNLKIKVVLGLDEKNERVSGVNPSMDAENNIMSYIVYKIYQEEFDKLDIFLKDFCKKENLYGLTDEYIHNMGSFASMDRNYFYCSISYLDYLETYSSFVSNPLISVEELQYKFLDELKKLEDNDNNDEYNLYRPIITISLYSSDKKLDESIFVRLENKFQKQSYLPDFDYSFVLSENSIDCRYDASKDIMYPNTPTETGYIRINKVGE